MKRVTFFTLFGFLLFCLVPGLSPCLAIETLEVKTPGIAASITHQILDNNMVVVSVTDDQGDPITGLGVQDFVVESGDSTANIISVEGFQSSAKVGLNLFLVLDNSASMKHRNAVAPLLSALEKLLGVIRPIDTVQVILFDSKGTYNLNGRNLHIKHLKSNDVAELRDFIRAGYRNLTDKTYLYEAMLGAVNFGKDLPKNASKLMVVFSDGEDINSSFKKDVVQTEADEVADLKIYAIDFMPTEEEDPFLSSLSGEHGGNLWKATASDQLVVSFDRLANVLRHQYVISYRFQPLATVTVAPEAMTIEEVTTVDTSPLLTHVYFETGESRIPERYELLDSREATTGFDPSRLKTTMDKYMNVLNIIGKRLDANPEATLTLVGCNSAMGEEEGRLDLSRARAEAIRLYLQYVWGIDYSRMEVKARHLPEVPTSNRLPEGQAENQRVEIYSDSSDILGTVKSVYVDAMSQVDVFRVEPSVQAVHDLKEWKISLIDKEEVLDSVSGTGPLDPLYEFPVKDIGLTRLMRADDVHAEIEILDKQGQGYTAVSAEPLRIKVLKKEQLLSQRLGYKVLEKYALILFDFDSAEIKGNNAAVLETIVARIGELDTVFVRITGHTDTIGSEAYNMELSKRRAKSVYDQLNAAGIDPALDIAYFGVGPNEPLYDNSLPEGRALNRTVTIELEYEKSG
jgi:outer membrane protein OmpA-like peptidoglycan-associated protein